MLRTLIIILIALVPLFASSQKKMNKQEIYSYWIKNDQKIENYKTLFDTSIIEFIDDLKRNRIDTMGIYTVHAVGFVTDDTCECGMIPWFAYIEWVKNKRTFSKKLTECCNGNIMEIDSSVLMNYYFENKTKIDNERIMPVIIDDFEDSHHKVQIKMITTDHTHQYQIYFNYNGIIKFSCFDQFELENEEGIFYKENNESKISSWKLAIENQLKRLN